MPIKDRLQELLQLASNNNREDLINNTIIESNEQVYRERDELQQLQQFVEDTSSLMDNLELEVRSSRREQLQLLTSPTADEKQIKTSLVHRSEKIRSLVKTINDKIKLLKQMNIHCQSGNYAVVRDTQHSHLLRKLLDLLNEHNQNQVQYRDAIKSKLTRQLEIINGYTIDSDSLVDNLVDQDRHYVTFASNQLSQLNQLNDRHDELTNLERSITEMNAIFVELDLLIANQGSVVDNIEQNVIKTGAKVNQSAIKIEAAKNLRDKAIRSKLICGVVTLILLVVGITLLAIYVPRAVENAKRN